MLLVKGGRGVVVPMFLSFGEGTKTHDGQVSPCSLSFMAREEDTRRSQHKLDFQGSGLDTFQILR